MVKSRGSGMASRAVDHPPQQARVIGGGGKPKKNSLADGRNRRALKEIGNLPNIRETEPNPCRRITRSYRAQLKAQAAEAADIIDLESSEDEMRQAGQSSFGFGKVVHQTAHFHVIDLDSSEDEQSQAVKSKFASAGVAQSAKQIDVIELESSEDEKSPKESVGDHDPKCSVSMEETLLIPQSSEVESTITTEAYEVENLQAQNEMTTSVELDSVTLEPLHADSLTDALTEQVWVDEHYVCCSDHGTGGRTEYVVCGHTIGSVSDIAAFEEKDQLEIGAADSNGEVEETLLIPQFNEVESTITTEAYEVENLHAQNEMTTRMELESVTLEPLHADSLTDALTEQVRVDEHYVCDCSDHGTGGRTEYVVCGHIGSVSEIAAFEEKDQLEIGAADTIGEVEETLLIPQSNEVENTITTEAYEVENLQAQNEMTTCVELESVTLEPLHADSVTDALTEQVRVDEHYVCDCSDHGTGGRTEYIVCGHTIGSVSDIAAFEEKDQLEIGAADSIGEVEETLLIPQFNEVESTITTEAYEVENLQAQNEMTTCVELESFTLEPLHADSLTDALTEQVRVDEHYVCDCSDHGTGGRTEYVVCGHTIGSVSDIAAFEEKEQLEIGAADSIGEVEVDLEYEEVDQQAEAPVDIKDLDKKGQLENGAVGNIVEVDLDQEYEKLCEHLQAQSEISSGAEVEFVTLGALHWDNMSASKEGVSVDGYPVFDYTDNGTMSDYEVFGNTMGSISDVASFEEKDQPEIGAADDIGEIVVDLKYKVDEEAEAKVDNEALEVQGLPETGSKVSMVNVVVLSIMISALISVLIGSTAFSYVKKGSSTLNLANSMNASPDVACNTAHIFQHIPSSWNWIKAPWHSKLSSFQKSSSYRLIGLQASTEDEVQEKRGATDSVCQQPLLTKNLSASSMPASTTQNFHCEMKSLQNSSFYQTQGLNESYEAERQEKGGSERTFEESPWLQLTPQYSYGSFTTTEKSIIKNGHGDAEELVTLQPHHLYGNFTEDDKISIKNGHADDGLISPQWARHLYGSFTTQEMYPIKNRHRDEEEAVTPQPYHLYGNFTTDEKTSNQECAAVKWR